MVDENGVILTKTKIKGGLKYYKPISIQSTTILGDCCIGAYSYIGSSSKINNTNIGNCCSIGPEFISNPSNHPTNLLSTHLFTFNSNGPFSNSRYFNNIKSGNNPLKKEKVIIGNDVWIGRRVVIMSGVTIGYGAIIVAGSIVTKDVSSFSIVGGIPSKLIKKRFNDILIQKIKDSKWWNFRLDKKILQINDYSDIEFTINKIVSLNEMNKLEEISGSLLIKK